MRKTIPKVFYNNKHARILVSFINCFVIHCIICRYVYQVFFLAGRNRNRPNHEVSTKDYT